MTIILTQNDLLRGFEEKSIEDVNITSFRVSLDILNKADSVIYMLPNSEPNYDGVVGYYLVLKDRDGSRKTATDGMHFLNTINLPKYIK